MEIEVFVESINFNDWGPISKKVYDSVIKNKAVVIKNCSGYIKELIESVYNHEQFDHPVNYHFDDVHRGLDKIQSKDYTEEDDYKFINSLWHTDESIPSWADQQTPALICMNMTTFSCDKKYGKTVFIDREKMLKDLDKSFVDKIYDKYILSLSNYSNIISHNDMNNFQIEDVLSSTLFSSEDGISYSPRTYPVISTHPITGNNSLNIVGPGYTMYLMCSDKNLRQEFSVVVTEYLSDRKNWVEWEWTQGDYLIWDNRSVIHSFSSGWTEDERIFSRADTGRYIPYFNIKSYSN